MGSPRWMPSHNFFKILKLAIAVSFNLGGRDQYPECVDLMQLATYATLYSFFSLARISEFLGMHGANYTLSFHEVLACKRLLD